MSSSKRKVTLEHVKADEGVEGPFLGNLFGTIFDYPLSRLGLQTKQQNNSTFLFNKQQLSSQESHRQRIPLSMSTSPTQRMPRARRRDVSSKLTLERSSLLDRTLARLHVLATAGENSHKT